VSQAFAVFCSGTGSNLQAILDARAAGHLPWPVALVLSNKADAPALERARRAGVPTVVVAQRDHATRDALDDAMARAVTDAGADWIALAGFMRLLTPRFLAQFPDRVLNIHPSLLPAFPGLHAQRQALRHGVKLAGCTVHFVDEGCDTGAIIAQAAVPVLGDDDEAALSARILVEEHRLYPAVLRAVAEGRVRLSRLDGRADGAKMAAWM